MSARELPLAGEYDVIVVGGGVAGAFAGIAAAREGLKSLIIEEFGALGGSATMGLVLPLMSSRLPGSIGQCSLGIEVTRRMEELTKGESDHYRFDSALMQMVLEEMAGKYGCRLLYYTMPVETVKEGDRISYLIVHNKNGLSAYRAAYYIDGTGDADLAVLAGVECMSGNDEGVNQPVSLRFEMAGVDFDRFHAYMRSLGYLGERYFAMNTPGMKDVIMKARDDGLLTDQDACYFQAFGVPGRPDAMAFNCPELTTQAGVVDADFLTQKQVEGKAAILRLRRFLWERIPGFEKAYITSIAPMVGFRESRRIEAEYVMTVRDILSYKKFPDGVCKSNYPLDVHGVEDVTLGLKYDEGVPKEERYWEVPYRCMVPKNVENLLVTGRCAGFDFRAQSATRIQLVCRAMGEAAGIAAAMAKGAPFAQVDGPALRRKLEGYGVE